MKKLFFIGLLLLILGSMGGKAEAWVFVPDEGDTGWQTYVYNPGPGSFSGTAGFVVSNVIDPSAFSELLLDNLSHGGGGDNRSFEVGNYSNFTLLGDSYGEVTSVPVMAPSFNEYKPVQGVCMSHQFALGPGISTAAFHNADGQAGTIGSILETAFSLAPGESLSFSWAFLGNDSSPYNDFSLILCEESSRRHRFFRWSGADRLPVAHSRPFHPDPFYLGIAGSPGLGDEAQKKIT